MPQLEVFFDYACPYCLKGHEILKELIPQYPRIEVVWCPCEAHPRPETYGPHSDLCIQGMFYAQDKGIDLWRYHDIMYQAALVSHIDIEDAYTLSLAVKDILDPESFCGALENNTYIDSLKNANHYAFSESGVWVVPAFRMNGKKLDAAENIGVTKTQLDSFLRDNL